MMFKSFLGVAILALVCAGASALDCSNKQPGRYCSSNKVYDWCYSSGPSATLQCPLGTECLCSYIADGNPCGFAGQAASIPGCETGSVPNEPQNPPNQPQQPQDPPQKPAEPQNPPQKPAEPQNPPPPPPPPQQPAQPQQPSGSGSCSLSSVSAAGASKKFVTYFTNWAQYRQGDCHFDTSMIQGNLFTHINFAFAKVDGATNQVQPYELNDLTDANNGVPEGGYDKLNALKAKYPHLKTLISLGGWSFGATIFSQMASSASSRATFIASVVAYARTHNFDGIDIDWEYPANAGQGGRPEDTENFSALLKEMRAAIESENRGNKAKLLLTIAAPAGEAAFAGLQLNVIHQYLDWINLMSYDLHGSWETTVGFNTPLNCASGDTVCIDYAVNAYIKAGTPPSKLVMGLGTYGHAWTLANPANTNPGAAASGPGNSGRCSGEAGFLSYYEIKDALAAGATEKYDATAAAQYAYWGNQWVSYDSPKSIKAKIDYANSKNLGGAMVWALDLDAPAGGFYELQCTAASALFGTSAGGGSEGAGDNFAGSDATFKTAEESGASAHASLMAVFAAVGGAALFFALAAFN